MSESYCDKKYRPIMFETDMVRAILEGRKTQTRRVKFKCDAGDILWVRETFHYAGRGFPVYKADAKDKEGNVYDITKVGRWLSPYYMKMEHSRLFLRVENVREERLQDISESDCLCEGIIYNAGDGQCYIDKGNIKEKRFSKPKDKFACLWDGINAKRGCGWDANPVVKVIEFRRAEI